MVLLKNDGLLPLSKADKIAFIGEFAASPRFQGGGSSHINCFKVTSALDAARDAGLNVTYAQGYSVKDDAATDEMIAQAVEAAKDAKAAVVFAGLPDAYESEGYDREHMRMPACQNRVIEAVAAANPNTVVVLHNGSPVEMPWIGRVRAVLEAYLGGQAVGLAAARVLFGDVNPSGHLAETFPLRLQDNPSYLYYGGEGNTAEYREGVFVGYRYYDKKEMEVLFPFGHGLSYTTFEYSNLRLKAEKTALDDSDAVDVTVTVKNTGSRFGKTAVQVYVGARGGDVIRPVRELKAFEKVALEPGESRDVTFTLPKRSFAYWNTGIHGWFLPAGQYVIQVGDSSRHLPLEGEITLSDTKELPRHYDMNSIFMDLMADPKARAILKPMMEAATSSYIQETSAEESQAAKEALNAEMSEAMMRYMPLRALVSFGADEETEKMLENIIHQIND